MHQRSFVRRHRRSQSGFTHVSEVVCSEAHRVELSDVVHSAVLRSWLSDTGGWNGNLLSDVGVLCSPVGERDSLERPSPRNKLAGSGSYYLEKRPGIHPSRSSLCRSVTYAWHPHRDTSYSALNRQANWWIFIYELSSGNVCTRVTTNDYLGSSSLTHVHSDILCVYDLRASRSRL